MNTTLFSFNNIKLDSGLMDEIWSFSPRNLESIDDITVSKYSIALAQYMIYFTSQYNNTKANLTNKKRTFDASIAIFIDADLLKKYKAKKDAVDFLVSTNPDLGRLNDEINILQDELIKLDGIDRSISELIATFKRELTRREKELFATRQERR